MSRECGKRLQDGRRCQIQSKAHVGPCGLLSPSPAHRMRVRAIMGA